MESESEHRDEEEGKSSCSIALEQQGNEEGHREPSNSSKSKKYRKMEGNVQQEELHSSQPEKWTELWNWACRSSEQSP